MKRIMLVVISPVLLLFFFLAVGEPQTTNTEWEETSLETNYPLEAAPLADTSLPETEIAKKAAKAAESETQKLVNYALSLIGTPYMYAGMSESGFDCSGFTTYVYEQSGITVGRSSSLQADEGLAVFKEDARPGDLLIFTGTNKYDRTPGHVGIVISSPGDTISFVHSSSVGGVKISQVEGTGYEERFLQVRRVMN